MKTKNTLYIIAGVVFCASAPLIRADCFQTCDSNSNTLFGGFFNLISQGMENTGIGYGVLGNNYIGGDHNTAAGFFAMYGDDASGSTGSNNTASGYEALYSITSGNDNTATGYQALLYNSTASNNTANGYQAMFGALGTTGSDNTAIGYQALFSYTSGSNNTASGRQALRNNTTGSFNTATGRGALNNNTTASNNTATGYQALQKNTTGISNTATGTQALQNNTGSTNTAIGYQSLNKNTTGSNNVAMGSSALLSNTAGSNNTAIGGAALVFTTGSNNIAIGLNAGVGVFSGSSNIDIGNNGANESSTIRIGNGQTNTYIAGISGVTVAGGIGVIVDSNGHLGTTTSSGRYKENIQPMDKASEAILSLQPVSFRYKKELDPKAIPQFGLIAEQVDKIDPDLVARDDKGKPYSVRYEAVNAMLLNEFLKEHKAFLEEQRTVEELKKQVAALTAGLQKVSARLEASKPAPQVVNNP
jgi:hypothetical protein